MEDKKFQFPSISKSIEDFIGDEEGNITRGKLVTIGTMIMIMTIMMAAEALAVHSSHSSHESHSSHVSSSTSSHSSHGSHSSHTSHVSHTSHSNTTSHSNSLYSAEGDVEYAPSAGSMVRVTNTPSAESSLPEITAPASTIGVSAIQNISGSEIDGSTAPVVNMPDVPGGMDIPATIPPQSFETPEVISTAANAYSVEEQDG